MKRKLVFTTCRQSKSNYHPISLLPNFGKIFEKLLFDAIYKHLCDHSLITPHQSGFRPGASTITHLLSLPHTIYTAFEDTPRRETRAVFLDLSKAFDRVWHSGLLYTLECNGICGNLLGIIHDFLHGRKQCVVLNGQSSNWSAVSASVPQGSVLGPLFFLVYINVLLDNLSCGVTLFPDDTSLFFIVKNELRKMQFNADKTEEVICSWKKSRPHHTVLKLGNNEIKQVWNISILE